MPTDPVVVLSARRTGKLMILSALREDCPISRAYADWIKRHAPSEVRELLQQAHAAKGGGRA